MFILLININKHNNTICGACIRWRKLSQESGILCICSDSSLLFIIFVQTWLAFRWIRIQYLHNHFWLSHCQRSYIYSLYWTVHIIHLQWYFLMKPPGLKDIYTNTCYICTVLPVDLLHIGIIIHIHLQKRLAKSQTMPNTIRQFSELHVLATGNLWFFLPEVAAYQIFMAI